MTYFEDTGTVIDAPIDDVSRYLVSEHHGAAHSSSARNFEVKETAGASGVIAAERFLDGRWSPFLGRSTDFPPFCVCNAEIEGDFAGTKFVLVYRPEGRRTRIDLYGGVRSNVFDAETARRKFLRLLEGAYDEDAAAMRKCRRPG
jgi:hypothetical protein